LRAEFHTVVSQLTAQTAREDFDQPLALWTTSSDRRLPYTLLDRTINELLATSFNSILAIPGIGLKKTAALIGLLRRVGEQPTASISPPVPQVTTASLSRDGQFDEGAVCESMWRDWRETVCRHALQQDKLGRFAPTLRDLARVVWHKPLEDYLGFSLDEIRSLKTHGDKRVHAVLEVFHSVYSVLGQATMDRQLTALLKPAFVPPIETSMRTMLAATDPPGLQDARQTLVLPVLNQIQHDTDDVVHRLAAGRLGVEGFAESVRDQARELDVTRARIYQLLEVCAEVMDVRWPEGRWLLGSLIHKLESNDADADVLSLLQRLQRLLFPQRTRIPQSNLVSA